MKAQMRVLFLPTGLATGGAEKQLARMLSRMQGRDIEAGVLSLTAQGPVSDEIRALGVPVWHLNLDRFSQFWRSVGEVMGLVRRFKPDIIQGWMYHGNLAALWLAGQCCPVVWGVRQSLDDLAQDKLKTRIVIYLGAFNSHKASAIIYNSKTSRRQHEVIGFTSQTGKVIGNGFNTEIFRPNDYAYASVRRELGLPANAFLIGFIARYHPVKGHEIFFKAAENLVKRKKNVYFILAGRDVTLKNPAFRRWLKSSELSSRIYLLGERYDIPRLTAALDVATSSSWSEAFPNAVAEAMCCGVPVVATDVGDTRDIVREAGIIVPRGDASALVQAWEKLMAMGHRRRKAMGMQGRKNIIVHHSIDSIVSSYLDLYEILISEKNNLILNS